MTDPKRGEGRIDFKGFGMRKFSMGPGVDLFVSEEIFAMYSKEEIRQMFRDKAVEGVWLDRPVWQRQKESDRLYSHLNDGKGENTNG